MRRYQFSLLGSLLVVVGAAVTFAAFRSASALWPAAFVTALVWVLAVAAVAAGVTRGESRAFWAGFATVGWIYVLLAYGPGFQIFSDTEKLLPHHIANYLHPRLQRTVTVAVGGPTTKTMAAGPGMAGRGGPGGPSMGMGGGMGSALDGMSGASGGMGGTGGSPGPMGSVAGAGMSMSASSGGPNIATTTTLVGPSWPHVWRICHTIVTMLLAIAGGILARSLYRRAHKAADHKSAFQAAIEA